MAKTKTKKPHLDELLVLELATIVQRLSWRAAQVERDDFIRKYRSECPICHRLGNLAATYKEAEALGVEHEPDCLILLAKDVISRLPLEFRVAAGDEDDRPTTPTGTKMKAGIDGREAERKAYLAAHPEVLDGQAGAAAAPTQREQLDQHLVDQAGAAAVPEQRAELAQLDLADQAGAAAAPERAELDGPPTCSSCDRPYQSAEHWRHLPQDVLPERLQADGEIREPPAASGRGADRSAGSAARQEGRYAL
jgi:hypothetical protein